jgi:hypothetical protein
MNQNKYIIHLFIAFLGFYTEGSFAQVAINTDGSPASTNTILDLNPAIGKAFVPPKMTWAQIKAISPASEGMMVYDTEFKTVRMYNGTRWVNLMPQANITAPPGSFTAQSPSGNITTNSVATDASGNVFITGSFTGTATFGTYSLTSLGGYSDFFIAKYNNSGVAQWAQKAGGTLSYSGAGGTAVVADASGNAYVTGYFGGVVSGAFSFTATFNASPESDAFVAKFNSNGTTAWAIREGAGYADAGTSILLDGSNNVYVAGYFTFDSMNATTIGGVSFLASSALNEAFVVKYNNAGTPIWAKNIDASVDAKGKGVAVDAAGNVYLAGVFTGDALYNSTLTASAGQYDGFIAKYNSAGTFQWFKSLGGTTNDFINGITVDAATPSNNIYITGSFTNTATFLSPSITLTSAGFEDAFVAKYNTSGITQWAKRAGSSTGNDVGNSIAIDASSNLFVTGSFTGVASFGSLPTVSATGGSDIFLTNYNSSGIEQWVQKTGGAGTDKGLSVALDAFGNVYTVGTFTPSVQFGNTLLSAGTTFLMKYSE